MESPQNPIRLPPTSKPHWIRPVSNSGTCVVGFKEQNTLLRVLWACTRVTKSPRAVGPRAFGHPRARPGSILHKWQRKYFDWNVITSNTMLESCTVHACPRPREGVRMLTSRWTSFCTCFLRVREVTGPSDISTANVFTGVRDLFDLWCVNLAQLVLTCPFNSFYCI